MGHNPAARTPSDFQIGENKWEDPSNKRLFGVEGTDPHVRKK